MIRPFDSYDIEKVKSIHEKYFKDEFEFPDFLNGFICAFVIADDFNEDIIAVGGVRTLAEAVLITNKDYTARSRRKALIEVLSASTYFASKSGHDSLHAFVQDPEWIHHLIRYGFKECVGKPLFISVRNT